LVSPVKGDRSFVVGLVEEGAGASRLMLVFTDNLKGKTRPNYKTPPLEMMISKLKQEKTRE